MATPVDITRIYVVTNGTHERLIRTSHKNYALTAVAREIYSVRVASQRDLERLLPGMKVEDYRPPRGVRHATEGESND